MTSQSTGQDNTLDVQLNLTSYKDDDVNTEQKMLSHYLNALQRENITEVELLEIFGVDESNLRDVLTPVSKNLLELFFPILSMDRL